LPLSSEWYSTNALSTAFPKWFFSDTQGPTTPTASREVGKPPETKDEKSAGQPNADIQAQNHAAVEKKLSKLVGNLTKDNNIAKT